MAISKILVMFAVVGLASASVAHANQPAENLVPTLRPLATVDGFVDRFRARSAQFYLRSTLFEVATPESSVPYFAQTALDASSLSRIDPTPTVRVSLLKPAYLGMDKPKARYFDRDKAEKSCAVPTAKYDLKGCAFFAATNLGVPYGLYKASDALLYANRTLTYPIVEKSLAYRLDGYVNVKRPASWIHRAVRSTTTRAFGFVGVIVSTAWMIGGSYNVYREVTFDPHSSFMPEGHEERIKLLMKNVDSSDPR